MREITISICPFKNGEFDVMFKDDDGNEIVFSGTKKLNAEELEFANNIAPACVWTKYQRITPED